MKLGGFIINDIILSYYHPIIHDQSDSVFSVEILDSTAAAMQHMIFRPVEAVRWDVFSALTTPL